MVEVVEDGGGLLLIVEGEGRRVPVPFVNEFLRGVDVAAGASSWRCLRGCSRHARPGPDDLPRAVRAVPGDQPGRDGAGEGAPGGAGPRPARVHGGPPPQRRRRAVRRRRRHGDDGAALDPRGARGLRPRRSALAGAALAAGRAARRRQGARAGRPGRELARLLCGRYEGIDERVRQTVVDEEVSIGDYVLSGGELPAMVLIEALSRQVPGVVGLADSVERTTASAAACSTIRTTRGRRWWRGWRCRRC